MDVYDVGGVRVERRALLKLAAAAGLLAVPGAGLLSGCAVGGGGNNNAGTGEKTNKNPFGVKADAPLEYFNFEGGYGKEWPKFPAELYEKQFTDAKVTINGGQQLLQLLQPRFIQGDPPDLIYNSGLDVAALVAQNQLQELTPLLKASAYDSPGKSVEESLVPGATATGMFDDEKYSQGYFNVVYGIWYSKPLLEQHGWEYPHTWDDMMALCAKIKAAGIAPWTHAGKYSGYIQNPILVTAEKAAGPDLGVAVDNLEPNAWRNQALIDSAERYHELLVKGYLLEGSAALSHTQSQTYWAERKVAFIPCGSWLESELGSIAPNDLGMTVAPPPGLSSSDTLPFEALQISTSGAFIVPSKGKNPAGGMGFLRLMLSKAASRNFSTLTNELTVVADYADTLDLSSAFKSTRDAIAKAGNSNVLKDWLYSGWYTRMGKAVTDATAALMSGDINGDEWSKRCQRAADDTAKDSTIKKYKR